MYRLPKSSHRGSIRAVLILIATADEHMRSVLLDTGIFIIYQHTTSLVSKFTQPLIFSLFVWFSSIHSLPLHTSVHLVIFLVLIRFDGIHSLLLDILTQSIALIVIPLAIHIFFFFYFVPSRRSVFYLILLRLRIRVASSCLIFIKCLIAVFVKNLYLGFRFNLRARRRWAIDCTQLFCIG